ncbi:MAG: indolepyruvate ferredoxin oxidoreductase family protein [Comamonadaceae bacterium]|nr:MAG: indolepyruvate ferredoxin oxidoreductase family protein [Comamonadaceae bacterium]
MTEKASDAPASAAATPAERPVSLEDRYDLREGRVLMSGTQVLARLPMEQRWRDERAGLHTGGFISGYRGSPLGGFDRELWRIAPKLDALNIRFQPGVNEDLAATAVWGTQYVNLYAGAKVDGVFGIWYGKSPGVDRSGDAFQHANTAGTAPNGGVIALVGDDHAAKSSSRAGQSDMQLKAAGMPILYPSSTQEILDYALHGIAMSRYSACWVSIKLVTDVVETTSLVEVGASRAVAVLPPLPTDVPAGGLHIRPNEPPLEMEARLYEHKLPAALAYARANGLNRILLAPAAPRLGIASAGKSWTDVRSALLALGLDDDAAERAGIRLLKIGMSWPVDPEIVGRFVEGLDQILVVEEKRPFLEEQIKAILQDDAAGSYVKVWGKVDPMAARRAPPGVTLLPLAGELTPQIIARTIAGLAGLNDPSNVAAPAVSEAVAGLLRTPNFCSGCPHNSSTVVPEGSRTMAGIGCHGMAMWIRADSTSTVTHMGAEGMFWVGQSGFTDEKHVFVNIGDGTFFHSGSLALRQAVAAKVQVTYKLLFNGYVSMTGGQKVDGDLTVPRAIDIALAEGVGRVVVVADDVSRYDYIRLPAGIAVRPRTELDAVQRELREFEGVSFLVYDQVCATERRRMRKRDPSLDVARRTVIHAEVCEGCGDCGVKSNCMSVEPLETELGRKRKINQSSCNKDFSCIEGFCPSFVTVRGGKLKRHVPAVSATPHAWGDLPMPKLPDTTGGYGILIAGIGGSGIVTIGAVLGMAAHIDGRATSVLDVTGMAQKYGAVMSHLRFAPAGEALRSARLGKGEVDLLIGCDLIVASGDEAVDKLQPGRSHAVVNTAINPTAEFPKMPDWQADTGGLLGRLERKTGDQVSALAASRIATALMGDAIAINMFMLGHAWQLGLVPVGLAAIEQAIRLNGVQVEFNRTSFEWGRRMAVDAPAVEGEAGTGTVADGAQVIQFAPRRLERLDQIVADRSRRLVAYQNEALATRYRAMVERAEAVDSRLNVQGRLAKAVARGYYKLLADKDEFEVARLYTDPAFRKGLEAQFEGDYTVQLNLGAWPFVKRDATTGVLQKREVGAWIFPAMKVLQALRGMRGTWLDPFRHNAERALAQKLLADYESDLQLVLECGDADRSGDAVALASLPEKIRGYGHVRQAHADKVEQERLALRERLSAPPAAHARAA